MIYIRRVCAAAMLSGASMAAPASAESFDRGALEALAGEPISISATGAPQRATEAPVNMTIITQEEIRRSGAIDIPGVLERFAQIDVMRTTSGQADVSIRGYNTTLSPRLLVLLNGRQVYLDHYGMTNWESIPVQLAEIRQIEIVSGPNTALFGFNAVSGVVNIITYDALRDDVDALAMTAGAPDLTRGAAVWTVGLDERLALRASIGGLEAQATDSEDAIARANYGRESVDPTARTGALNLAFAASSSLRADLEATWSSNERMERFFGVLVDSEYEASSFKLAVDADTSWGMLSAQAYSNDLDVVGHDMTGSRQDYANQITVGSATLVAKPAPAHTLRVTGEYRRNTFQQDAVAGEVAYDDNALSGMWNWQASEPLALTSAVRVDMLKLEHEGAFVSASFPFDSADYDRDLTAWSFNLGAVYQLTGQDTLRLSAARGVGSPSLAEFGFQIVVPSPPPLNAFYAGDPAIAPTVVEHAEAGWDRGLPSLGGALRASVFWQRNKDAKMMGAALAMPTPTTIIILSDNVGDSDMYGAELSLTGQSGRLSWRGAYSRRRIDDKLAPSAAVLGLDYERGSPEHVLTAAAEWIDDRWEFGADMRYTSETVQFGLGLPSATPRPLAPLAVDAYVQANARVAWHASDAAQVELSARNLLEARTQTVGLSPVSRGVYLTLSTGF